MLNFSSLMIGTSQPKVLAEFYEKVFNRPADMNEGGWFGWNFGDFNISVGEHSEVHGSAKEPQRVIINFESKDVKGEFERLSNSIEDLDVIKEPYVIEGWEGGWIATIADPDGNYFQLMSPWEGQ